MTEVVLVRHGESEHNKTGTIQGQIDSELTSKGRNEARKLGEFLSGESFDRIYSSDLKRARETAEIAVGGDQIEVVETEKLRERDYGEIEGESFKIWNDLETEDHHEWKAENAESLKEHKERTLEVLEEAVEKDVEKVLMVAHGGTISALLMDILNCESRQAWRFGIDNCSITEISHSSEGWIIEKVNDTCHMEE